MRDTFERSLDQVPSPLKVHALGEFVSATRKQEFSNLIGQQKNSILRQPITLLKSYGLEIVGLILTSALRQLRKELTLR